MGFSELIFRQSHMVPTVQTSGLKWLKICWKLRLEALRYRENASESSDEFWAFWINSSLIGGFKPTISLRILADIGISMEKNQEFETTKQITTVVTNALELVIHVTRFCFFCGLCGN